MSETRIIAIVDGDDTVLAYKREHEIDYAIDIYRVSALWVTNTMGEVLLAQRSLKDDHQPGFWGPAAAGTVEQETYEENMVKEAEEELGLRDIELTHGPKVYTDTASRKYFCQWFTTTLEPDVIHSIVCEEGEVEKVAWIAPNVLRTDVEQHPERYIPSFSNTIKLFL